MLSLLSETNSINWNYLGHFYEKTIILICVKKKLTNATIVGVLFVF